MSQDVISLLRDSSSSGPLINPESSGYDSLSSSALATQATTPSYGTAKKLPQYIAAIAATLSALASGLVLGWTSPILEELENGKLHGIKVNNDQMGWIGSFATLGAMTMCFPTGFVCDLIGRKKTLMLLIVPFGLGWLLILTANSVFMLYLGRLITGMAVGACCVAAPLYTSEIAQKDIRGTLGSYFQVMITVGVFMAYLMGKYMNAFHFTIFCATMPAIFLIFFVFQPKTPIYCLKRGLYAEAQASLSQLRGPNYDINGELTEMEGTLKERSQISVSFLHTFRQRATKKALIISLSLMFFQQLSGVNTVILYASDMFKESGGRINPNSAALLVGGTQVLVTFVSSLLVDRLGRKMLLALSGAFMSIAWVILAVYFTLKNRTHVDVTHLWVLPPFSLCQFIIAFSLGMGPIPWMISSEIFPPEIRSLASSASGTFNWFLAFLVTKFYLQVNEAVGEDTTFYVFAVVSLLSVIVAFVIPETKGKTIEQIQMELGN